MDIQLDRLLKDCKPQKLKPPNLLLFFAKLKKEKVMVSLLKGNSTGMEKILELRLIKVSNWLRVI